MRSITAVIAVVVAALGPPATAQPRTPMLIVSIDGLSWDMFERHRSRTPVLAGLATRGAAGPSTTVFPSVTWPAHATLVTGRTPAAHGVIGNYYWDRTKNERVKVWERPAARLVRAATLFELVHRHGLTTAGVLWPNTQGAPGLTWNVPELYEPAHYVMWVTPGLVDQLEAAGIPARRLARHSQREMHLLDTLARDIARHLIVRHKPALHLVHFVSVDTYAHKFGPLSPEVGWGLRVLDGYLGELLAAYREAGLPPPNVMVVSDHGFSPVRWRLDVWRLFHLSGLAPRPDQPEGALVHAASNGYALYLYGAPDALDHAVAVLRGLGVVQEVLKPAAYAALGLPARGEDPRMPDRIVLAKRHTYFKRTTNGLVFQDLKQAGMHGHRPEAEDNRPAFIAAGPGFRQGAAVGMRNVDVAPTAARLFGLTFPGKIEGEVKAAILFEQ